MEQTTNEMQDKIFRQEECDGCLVRYKQMMHLCQSVQSNLNIYLYVFRVNILASYVHQYYTLFVSFLQESAFRIPLYITYRNFLLS